MQTATLTSHDTLHQELLSKLSSLCREDIDIANRFAAAVFTCEEYIQKLYALLPEYGFEDSKEEIHFFKVTKPLFVSQREFHQRLYHAYTFENGTKDFWERELCRMKKLLAAHTSFICYYKQGGTENDHCWFRQGQAPMPTSMCMSEWETIPKHTSARDGWVSGLLAVDRYCEWLESRIEKTDQKL